MNSLGSNHSIPSTSVSTGSQGSSINSMQEVMDESSSDLSMMHPYDSIPEPSTGIKKVRAGAEGGHRGAEHGEAHWQLIGIFACATNDITAQ